MTQHPVHTLAAWCAHIRGGALSRAEHAQASGDARMAVQKAWAARLRATQAKRREAARLRTMLCFEVELWRHGVCEVVGVDEVGAGPLAGPVVAAAVVLPAGTSIPGINDSKALTAGQRLTLAQAIEAAAHSFSLAQASVAEIDAFNIRNASMLAMRRAVHALPLGATLGGGGAATTHVLVDAHTLADLGHPQTAIIKGDTRSQSIAAASILAKVRRDADMQAYALAYPGYGFEVHKGYGTSAHLSRLEQLGPSPIHRRTFAPIKAWWKVRGAPRR